MERRTWLAAGAAGAVVLLLGGALLPGCTTGYLMRQGYFQAELLAGRVPLDEAIASGELTPDQVQRLEWVPRIKAFGDELGLSPIRSYESINPTFDRSIWNVSACDPVAFRPRRWWFPVVGSVPYLGYFREEDARHMERRLDRRGYDVYVRTAGAYSTLGWFRDPVLPGMLEWSEYRLAETILHELTHSTLWIPGSVQFNESFANFVGVEAALRYLVHTYGEDSPELRDARTRLADGRRFRDVLHGVYEDLDAAYSDESLTDAERLAYKEEVLSGLDVRVRAAGLEREERYLRYVREGTWNNARLYQFRTYNRSQAWFAEILEQEGGDLAAFIERIDTITREGGDPYAALARAVGAEVPEGE